MNEGRGIAVFTFTWKHFLWYMQAAAAFCQLSITRAPFVIHGNWTLQPSVFLWKAFCRTIRYVANYTGTFGLTVFILYYIMCGAELFIDWRSKFLKKFLLIDFFFKERKGKRERKRNIGLVFHLCMLSLVDSRMCPHQGLNHILGLSGQCSNQLSCQARAEGVNI